MVSSNDVQRLFLQAVLSRRVMTREIALKLWENALTPSKINEALNPMNMEFAQMSDEITGKEMCALVNRKGDEVAQLATEYTPLEIAYFKAVLHQIMSAPNEAFCISSMAALRETNNLNMTKSQAEVVLSSFVAKGWLIKSRSVICLFEFYKSPTGAAVLTQTRSIFSFTTHFDRVAAIPPKHAEAEAEPSQPSQASQPSQPKGTQAKKNKKKAVREDSMDIDEDEPEPEPEPRKTQKRKSRR
ncbi:uncharacterized protein B0H18DRAFT_1119120 [Fomitopsis serialis]|uniref:uncharacterized protein n=1 Tax=Fomitopsis serialis TaxID=139415 RepID=UPI002007CF24|nr:uncharacterized protein B0H18DRAFT_1119120 [Neoantrodia serialis]KAH9926227.1 hypothetical protein B0H18DRAFT_1119120 [Neoantrodia serialis]